MYHIQFATGNFVLAPDDPNPEDRVQLHTGSASNAGTYAFYNTTKGGDLFGWNLNSEEGKIVDNNGAGNDLSFWGKGKNAATSGNNVWKLYHVSLDNQDKYTHITYELYDSSNNTCVASSQMYIEVNEELSSEEMCPAELGLAYYYATSYTYEPATITKTTETTVKVYAHADYDALPFTISENEEDAVWYCLRSHPGYTTCIYTEGDVARHSGNSQYGVGQSGDAYRWAFVGSPISGIKIINKASGWDKYLTHTTPDATMSSENTTTWRLMKKNDTRFGFLDPTDNMYLNDQKGNLKYWSEFDDGSTFWVCEDESETYDAVLPLLENLLTTTYGDTFGEGLGKYYYSDEYTKDANEIENISEKFDYIFEQYNSIRLNMPKDKTFLRIKGKNSGKYMSNGTAEGSRYTMTEDADATTIFYYADGKLLNYNNGSYNATSSNNWGWAIGQDNASTVTFADGNTSGGYAISTGVATTFFYDHGAQHNYVDRGNDIYNITGTNDLNYRSWILEEVTDLPLTLSHIGDKYYSTLNLPVDVTISGANAYAPTLSDNNTIICDKAINEVPAETPVILISDEGANAVATIGTVSSDATSALSGTIGKTPNTGNNVYVLSYDDNDVVAFYKYTGENIPGFKAYFAQEAGAIESAKFAISFADDDDITAVESVEAAASSAENAVYYDLQGRRVVAPQAGQLYIVNGKKVVY